MINFDCRTKFFMKSTPTDMRKGYEGLASIVRDVMRYNPRNYNEAFVFYSKDYRKVKILHYDINGWVLCSKWFTDGKFLKPEFEECKITHELSRETLILIMSLADDEEITIPQGTLMIDLNKTGGVLIEDDYMAVQQEIEEILNKDFQRRWNVNK